MGTIELVPVDSDDEEDAHEYTDSDDDVDSAIDVNEEFEVEAYVAAENHTVSYTPRKQPTTDTV